MPNWTSEQREAIDKEGSNIIVSAGAGSGKTAVLTERVIRKLEAGVNINELLVLTFTKMAAKEMKEKIRKAIKKKEALKNQLNYLDSSYITTFDSYALSVVKKYHYLLNIDKDINIVDSTIIKAKKCETIDKVFDSLYESKQPAFLKLIGDLCTKDDQSIKKMILKISEKLDLKYDKKSYLNSYINNYYEDSFIKEATLEYEANILEKVASINKYLDLLESYVDADYHQVLCESLEPLLSATNYEEVFDNLNVQMPNIKRGSDEEAKNIKDNISSIISDLKKKLYYSSIQDMKQSILKTREYAEAIILIIKSLDKEVNSFKDKSGMYEFIDISKLAIKILKENDEVSLELKNYYNEILIDEYQDTNDLQEEFVSQIENNNVYMVGDIKQSIYRFRNANPELFKSKYSEYSKGNNGYKIDLNKNFRSRREVLSDINIIFDDIMSIDYGGADYKDSHRMIFGKNEYENIGATFQNQNLEAYIYNYDKSLKFTKEEIEIFCIANDISLKIANKYQVFDKDNNVLRDATYKDFVILIDRSTNFEKYKKIFEYLMIPITKYSSTNITEESDTLLIKNIIGLLLSIRNEAPPNEVKKFFMSISRSYLFRYSDEELFDYVTKNTYRNSSLWNIAFNIAMSIDNLTIQEIVIRIIDDFDIYKSLIKAGGVESAINRLEFILSIAVSFSGIGRGVEDFYNYLDIAINDKYKLEVKNAEGYEDSVKLMTIHASKGLEYHITYFPGLYAKFSLMDLNEQLLFDNKYGIITPYFDDGIGETIYKYLAKENYIKEEISEKVRLFYVAMTRSKEKMILLLPHEETKKEKQLTMNECRSFMDFMSMIKAPICKSVVDTLSLNLTRDYNVIKEYDYKTSIKKIDKKVIKRDLVINRSEIKKKKFSKENKMLVTEAVKRNMEFGNYMHYLMEMIDFKNPDFTMFEMYDTCVEKIKHFLNLIDFKNASIYKEYEFLYRDSLGNNHHGVIDLMLEYDDNIKIIDYKLKNIDDYAYVEQLNGYREYIQYKSKKNVSIYLYSFNDELLKEINTVSVS